MRTHSTIFVKKYVLVVNIVSGFIGVFSQDMQLLKSSSHIMK